MTRRCYFAHPKGYYGSSLARDAIARLASAGYDIEDPSLPEHQKECRKLEQPMAYFEKLVASCDAICFIRFDDGAIGAGCAAEIDIANNSRLDILEFSGGELLYHLSGEVPGPRLDIAETRQANERLAGTSAQG